MSLLCMITYLQSDTKIANEKRSNASFDNEILVCPNYYMSNCDDDLKYQWHKLNRCDI